ncbi:hypothetical protein [Plantactinospora endophytica]|uniref:ABC transporter permease n=1 Tax=Plantactinospora endophytica TaxID=673535 RepID=A0ABQ4E5W1_9ACTN|nr:hypothetical protein [Plantactinospora endophytica]GIG89702.1 hypothetical protein Pen02_46380 [Plantactinospora endophytica]
MTALARMRLAGFVRTARALPPLITGLVALSVLYGGGAAQAAEAYGVSAVVLFPVLAWQTKLLLDTEPDIQRRLAVVAAGRRAELTGGLVAALLAGLALVPIALVLPWLVGGVTGPERPGDLPIGLGLAVGLWAHLLVLPVAVALGALASRAATSSPLYGLTALVGGVVGAYVFGLKDSVLPWIAPPVLATARVSTGGPTGWSVALLTGHALLWSALALAGYAWLRRRRT